MLRETKIETGFVRGVPCSDPNITVYRGIPFAAPPVGELRWRAPQPAQPWEGVRECYNFGPMPMQGKAEFDPKNPALSDYEISEDCLYLNVWTPAKSADEKLPVMLWIFGGAYMYGSPTQTYYEGAKFASRGVVFVSCNYRVNMFSWFAHPELTKAYKDEGYTNFGFLDQVAALKWINRNIAAFGGDPDNVTLFGHSAGGGSTLAHCVSDINKGLFHKAIVMSGGGIRGGKTDANNDLAFAEQTGVDFINWLGCKSLDEARKIDAKTLYDKAMEFARLPAPGMEKQHFFRWTHLTDGYFLKEDWTVALLNRHQHKIPIMVGHALHDFPTVSRAKTLAEFEAEARALYEDRAEEYLDIVDFKCGDLEQIKKNATYSLQCIGTLDWCEHSVRNGGFPPMYAYNFDQPVPGDPSGPSHGAEVPFAFGNLYYTRKPYRGVHYDLERQLNLYWTNFAKNSDPNGLDDDGSALPEWSAYSAEKPFEMRFKGGPHMENEQPKLMKFLVDWSLDWHKKNPVK